MRVILEMDILSKARPTELGAVFHHGLTGRHLIVAEDRTSSAFVSWLDSLSLRQREECKEILNQGDASNGPGASHYEVRIADIESSDWNRIVPRLSLRDAIQLLGEPFRILLEDDENDRAFLLSMAEREQQEYIQEMEGDGHVRFQHGGGLSKMKSVVERDRQRNTISFGRLWLLFDSDGLRPNSKSRDAKRLEKACGEKIPKHCLSRRSIENYLPLTSLKDWVDRLPPRRRGGPRAKYGAFRTLTAEQRHHYNMKNGFGRDARRQDAASAGDLYDSLNDEYRETLADGFDTGEFKVASLFRCRVSERQLRRDGGWDEVNAEVARLIRYIR